MDASGTVITNSDSVTENQAVKIRLHQGTLDCRVIGKNDA